MEGVIKDRTKGLLVVTMTVVMNEERALLPLSDAGWWLIQVLRSHGCSDLSVIAFLLSVPSY